MLTVDDLYAIMLMAVHAYVSYVSSCRTALPTSHVEQGSYAAPVEI